MIIDLKNISVSFDGEPILKNLNLYIRDKEFITLLGPSGCGKTTTLRIIGGFLEPDEGTVIFDGKKINGVPPHKRQVNTIFQRYALFPHLDVYENIAFGLRVKKWPEKKIRDKVNEMLALVNLKGTNGARSPPYPAGSSSASPLRVRLPTSRACCFWMSRSARSTSSCARICRWS